MRFFNRKKIDPIVIHQITKRVEKNTRIVWFKIDISRLDGANECLIQFNMILNKEHVVKISIDEFTHYYRVDVAKEVWEKTKSFECGLLKDGVAVKHFKINKSDKFEDLYEG